MSNLTIVDSRWLVNYNTTSGIQPTIPLSSVTSEYDWTYGDWLDTDILVGELFMNTADDKLWMRTDNGITLLSSSGAAYSQFIDLTDTPATYVGNANKYLKVNVLESAIEFEDFPDVSFINLSDTPTGYTGYDGYSVIVDETNSALTFSLINNSFLGLSDTPTGYTNGYLLQATSTDLEFIDGSTLYLDLTTNQNISGEKTFDDKIIVSDFYFSGITEDVNILNISSDSGFSFANDEELSTSLSIKNYVDYSIATAAGITGYTGDWVTISTNQTITGDKTFNADLFFNNVCEFNSNTTFYDYVNFEEDILIDKSKYFYFGSDSDGSYRLFINVDGDLTIEKRISGVWTFKGSF
jgi:hypothetical protein